MSESESENESERVSSQSFVFCHALLTFNFAYSVSLETSF